MAIENPANTPSDPEAAAVWANLAEVPQTLSIVLGRTEASFRVVTDWSEGSLIELDEVSGQSVDVLVNGTSFARAEVVTIAENFGIRLVEMIPKDG
jgi:flagellar motor switch protein FliN